MTSAFFVSLFLSCLLFWACCWLVHRLCCGVLGAVLAVSRSKREVPRDDKRRASGVGGGQTGAMPVSEGAKWTQIEAYTKRAEEYPRP